MNFRRQRRDEVGVDLTPLIDVVFLLLIFFMVSTTFIRETQLKIDLPEASGELQEIGISRSRTRSIIIGITISEKLRHDHKHEH